MIVRCKKRCHRVHLKFDDGVMNLHIHSHLTMDNWEGRELRPPSISTFKHFLDLVHGYSVVIEDESMAFKQANLYCGRKFYY